MLHDPAPRDIAGAAPRDRSGGAGNGERHLASLLLHVRPDRADSVRATLAAMPGVELHIEQQGKMVVTVEGPHEGWIADRMTAMHLLDGVMSAVLVFHHLEPASPEAEEVQPARA